MVELIYNVTVTYIDNNKEHFDAIRITDDGAHVGNIIDNMFVPFGFIPNHSVKQINDGNRRKIKKKCEFKV
jgi:hypothetical protein